MARAHRIAVVPGDGIGKETVPEALKVLDAAARRFGFELEFAHYDWSCETYKKTGAMMPADGMERLAQSDSILLGAVGWPDVPDHISLWGLLIPIRRGFDQYVNLRPCKLMPGVRTPLAGRTEADIDFYVVRENTEGEYSSVGGRMFEGTDREFVSQQSVLTRHGVDRILKFAFELAMTRPKRHLTSATKSNGITFTMPYWDERFALMGEDLPGDPHRPVPHRHPVRAFRPAPRLVRRCGGVKSVRRHPVRPRPRGGGLDRHRAVGQHQSGADVPLDVRTGARLGARHRRQIHLQSDRPGLVGRADAASTWARGRPAKRSSPRSKRCCARAGPGRATWAARRAPRMSAAHWRRSWPRGDSAAPSLLRNAAFRRCLTQRALPAPCAVRPTCCAASC